MGEKVNAKSFILSTICMVLFPFLFPFWYAKNIKRFAARTRLVYFLGFSWFVIWTLFITVTIAPTRQISYIENSSDIESGYIFADNYEQQSKAYEDTFYERLKNAQPKAERINNESNESVANNANKGSNAGSNTSNSSDSAFSGSSNSQTYNNSSSAMSGITIAEPDGSPYRRADYGSGWNVSTGCNIRSRLLFSQSIVQVQTSDGCLVTYGSWIDPYSGSTLTGNPYRGDGTENDLDIDHIIPLKYVNSHGGYAWSSSQKQSYAKSLSAMNNGVYIAVSSTENRKKGDKGPADYYPSNPNFYCEYSKRWRDIARLYSISLSQRDYNKVEGVLAQCGIN